MPTTLRSELDGLDFDWDTGKIVFQPHKYDTSLGVKRDPNQPPRFIEASDPILDQGFNPEYGLPTCPFVFARDQKAVYFTAWHDGSSWIERVAIDPEHYLTNNMPYVGGG